MLRKKGVLTRDNRNASSGKKIRSEAVINRLYAFYVTQKNPSNRPYYEAYAQQKNVFQRIERLGHEARITTPRGLVTGRKYIRDLDKRYRRTVDRGLPENVTIRYGRFYRTVKHVRDEFVYRIRPPVTATQATSAAAEKKLEHHREEIIRVIRELWRVRRNLYRNHAIGGIIAYHTSNIKTVTGVINPEGYIRIPWVRFPDIDLFGDALRDGFETAVSIVFNYPGGSVRILSVSVYISTVWRGTNIHMLRATS